MPKISNMIGTVVNTTAVVIGSCIGLGLKKSIPESYKNIFFQTTGLITLALGFAMVASMKHLIVVIFSMVIGTFFGTWCKIEERIERLGEVLKNRFNIHGERFSEGLITAFLMFCVGSMTILGAIEEGLGKSSDLLITKSVLDGFSSIILSSVFGIGVLLSALPLFLFQAAITLLAMQVAPFFTSEMIECLTSVGGIMMIGLGLNILEIKKIPVSNMLPALLFVCLFMFAFQNINV